MNHEVLDLLLVPLQHINGIGGLGPCIEVNLIDQTDQSQAQNSKAQARVQLPLTHTTHTHEKRERAKADAHNGTHTSSLPEHLLYKVRVANM